jgi:hypothetical protein
MDQNKDWRPMAALVLAGLALFVALSGGRGGDNAQVSAVPQQIIVQPAAPSTAPSGGALAPAPAPVAPAITAPGDQGPGTQAWRGWRGGGWPIFPIFPLLFLAGLIFVASKLIRRSRYGWGGPGWYGRPWSGPGPGPQEPPYGHNYGQYPPQYPPQGQNQPYSGYPQGQQPPQAQQGQGQGQGQQPQQGQPTQSIDPHGDITRPEGNGE